MKILVGQHELKIDKKDKVNQNEYKVTKCEFEFDEAITYDLVKIALFTNSAGTYKQYIINNECDIPAEILEKQETTTLGVYAYKEENEELELRYSPEEIKFYVSNGSYKENAENTEPITPTDKEQMEQALQNGLNDINNKIDEVDEKLDGIDTAIEETNNLNLDVSDKVDGDVTVTLTKKDASTKTVVISDGTSLEFNWDGTKLGIKTSDEEEYTYVDLQGIQGIKGDTGEPFTIKKTYSSVAEMNADFNNMEYGDYVMIASSVEVEDNAKLYTRGESQWIFITDFSGATGIRGPVGTTPNIQIGSVTSGSTPSVTRTGTDENPVLNFVLQKGDKGDKGNTGDTGNGISSIEKTSTSGLVDTYTITYTNGNTTTFNVSNGNGIDRIEKTATVGNKDTYTIYFTNGSTTTYEVSNGEVTREELEEEVDRLSMIYNAFPSTTGEGEEPSINGTAEVPFKEIGLKGNTSQESTTGKNKVNIPDITLTSSGYIYNGAISLESGSYTLTLDTNVSNASYSIAIVGGSGTLVSGSITTPYTFTINENAISMRLYSPVSGEYKNIMVRLSSVTDDTYEPYTGGNPAPNPDYPMPVNVVTGDNEVKVEGKNLAYTGWAEDFVSRINYSPYAKLETKDNRNCLKWNAAAGSGSYDTKYMFKTNWKENTQYSMSFDIYSTSTAANICFEYTDGTAQATSTTKDTWVHKTFTSTSGKTIKSIRAYYSGGDCYIDLDTFMVYEGTDNANYVPYQSQTYPINLGSMELCKIGDYQDYLYKENGIWYKYGAIGKTIITNDNTNIIDNYAENYGHKQITISKSSLGGSAEIYTAKLVLMNNYHEIRTTSAVVSGAFATNFSGSNIFAWNDNFTDLATAKSLMIGTIIYNPLATPTITPITDTTLIEQLDNLEKAYSYDTQTNISQTNQDKPFIISYEAILSLKNVLNS